MSLFVSGNDLLNIIRDLLDEEYAKQWTNPKLLRYLNYAKNKLLLEISARQGECEYFYTNATITTTASTQGYDLPDGTLYSGASKCNGHVDFIVDQNDREVHRMDWRDMHDDSSSDTLRGFTIKHKTLYLYPTPESAFDITLYYFYTTADIEATDTAIDFIPDCEYAIALQAIILGNIQVQDDIETIKMELEEYKRLMAWSVSDRIHGKGQYAGEDEHGEYY